jgi:hypothetical protein
LASEKPQSGYALCGIFLRHIFAVAGMLRIPLSQLQKRRKLFTLCETPSQKYSEEAPHPCGAKKQE